MVYCYVDFVTRKLVQYCMFGIVGMVYNNVSNSVACHVTLLFYDTYCIYNISLNSGHLVGS
jgi:hypothetical protein